MATFSPIQPRLGLRQKGFQFSADDIILLKLVYDYRYVQIQDLADLTGRGYRKVQERLLKLAERKYLWRKKSLLKPHIYGIGKEGIGVLVEQGYAARETLNKRLRHHELRDIFLDHALMVVDIHKRLELAGRTGDIALGEWQDGRQLRDKVTVLDGQPRHLTVWPDGFFVLEDRRRPEGQNRARFFLEADRSTTSHGRFQEKVTGYWRYLDSGQYSKRYNGSRAFRVITVTLTAWRARELCRATQEVLPEKARKFFLFTSLEDLSGKELTAIFGEVFISPKDPQPASRYPLLSDPTFTIHPASASMAQGDFTPLGLLAVPSVPAATRRNPPAETGYGNTQVS